MPRRIPPKVRRFENHRMPVSTQILQRNVEIMRLWYDGEPAKNIGDRFGLTEGGVWCVIAAERRRAQV